MHTNLHDNRFHNVIRDISLRQLRYPQFLFSTDYQQTCSACGDTGHNKNNKICPFHPCHPTINPFPDSEPESDDDEADS